MDKLNLQTQAIRSQYQRSHEGEHSEAIYETSSYVYSSSLESANVFSGQVKGNVYSRFTNPTVREFENRLAVLESAESCVATASGMSALLAVFMTFLSSGEQVICSKNVFGSTAILLRNYFAKYGIEIIFADLLDLEAFSTLITPRTKMVFFETPCNPTLEIIDIEKVCTLCRAHDLLVVVDNTFLTPFGQNPLLIGADIVVHSTSKYIDGQGRTIGGAALGQEHLIGQVRAFMRCAGPSMNAHTAWVVLKGLETLSLRMDRHCHNAALIAQWLKSHDQVTKVLYPGLESHPQYAIGLGQHHAHGAVISFIVEGGKQEAWKVIDAMKMISLTTNIGDAKSMVTHPASTTHAKLDPLDRAKLGIGDNLIRISVGLEDVGDIISDLDQALALRCIYEK